MKIVLLMSPKRRETMLLEALVKGFKKHNEEVLHVSTADYRGPIAGMDIAAFVGVKSRRMYQEHHTAKITTLLIDKAYFDRNDSYRLSLGDFQPHYLQEMKAEPRRLASLGVRIHERRTRGKYIIYAGSSQKYCDFHELGDCNAYAVKICAAINKVVATWPDKDQFRVLYRPKPSWWANETPNKVVPPGTTLSGPTETLARLLPQTHCIVTHGSNSAAEAMAAGVPVITTSVLGECAVYPLCEHDINKLRNPFWPDDAKRNQVLANLAWCQFTPDEIASGFAWASVKKWVRG